ncbi:MAG TPA: DUF2218 domain-containing protein [Kribbella sp.]|nr:DUF2218 domain-containing protein [Kribbella sp.]
MLIAEARIETERPSRYLVQLCKHAASMAGSSHRAHLHLGGAPARHEVQVDAEWSDTHGTVVFSSWGRCALAAGANTLTVRIEATDEQSLRRIQDVVTGDLDRFGRRDGLTVSWRRSEATGDGPAA